MSKHRFVREPVSMPLDPWLIAFTIAGACLLVLVAVLAGGW